MKSVELDESQGDIFETLLSAAGFRWEDDYSDFRWLEGPSHAYTVRVRLPTHLRHGPSNGRWRSEVRGLPRKSASPFEVPSEALLKAVRGGS